MKVVDDKTKDWKMVVKCSDCGSGLEISEADVVIGEFGWYGYAGESGDLLPYVACPCGADVKVKVPAWVERRAERRRSG